MERWRPASGPGLTPVTPPTASGQPVPRARPRRGAWGYDSPQAWPMCTCLTTELDADVRARVGDEGLAQRPPARVGNGDQHHA